MLSLTAGFPGSCISLGLTDLKTPGLLGCPAVLIPSEHLPSADYLEGDKHPEFASLWKM